MTVKECIVEDCTNPLLAKGLCSHHYHKGYRSSRICSVNECTSSVNSKDLCSAHLLRLRAHGDVIADVPIRKIGVRTPCSISGCPNDARSRKMCPTHYERWRKTGDAKADSPIGSLNPRNFCSVGECDLPCVGQGLCGTHYQRLLKKGDVLESVPRRLMSLTGICDIDDCNGVVQAYGLCGPHGMRKQRYGDPLGGPPLMRDMPKICIVLGCDRKVAALGYCNPHAKRVKTFGDPMADKPIRSVRKLPCQPGFKWCSQCEEELLVGEFGPKATTPDGLNRWCYICVWRRFIFITYNISFRQYELMLKIQDGRCYICKRHETVRDSRGRIRRLSVDHYHGHCSGPKSCGECVRGLLCSICNRILGMLDDDPLIADAMAQYLRDGGATYLEEVLNGRSQLQSDDQCNPIRGKLRRESIADQVRGHIAGEGSGD